MSIVPFNIFIVYDNISDASLLKEAFPKIRAGTIVNLLSDSRMLPAYFAANSPVEFFRAPSRPNLLILQISMSHYSGLETLKWVRSHRRFDGMPVIMITSPDNTRDRTEFHEAGADAYFVTGTGSDGFALLAMDVLEFCRLKDASEIHGPTPMVLTEAAKGEVRK